MRLELRKILIAKAAVSLLVGLKHDDSARFIPDCYIIALCVKFKGCDNIIVVCFLVRPFEAEHLRPFVIQHTFLTRFLHLLRFDYKLYRIRASYVTYPIRTSL